MPSTYSPDLRIELIATGEQSGTWGTTTNINLGTLIEDAIAGYVSVSITSLDQALTAQNGAADQARNMVINLTTTTGANFNVYVPPASKFYIVRNSSAHQATIYCSTVLGNTTAAGTGAVIPAGAIFAVFSDGTNVVQATGSVASGGTGQVSYTVGDILFASTTAALSKLADVATGNALISGGVGVAPSYGKIGLATHVSGTLPVVNGGTGVTSSTGTGSVVLSTSPTLVTPALGTPSSGTVTNLTGTASININGTVGATTPSTGAFTTLSATGVTTVQAGTAAAPAITTSGDTNTGIYFPSADTVAITTGGTQALTVNANGDMDVIGRLRSSGNQSVPAWTTTGVTFDAAAATFTDNSTAPAGVVATRAVSSFNTPTLASTNAITVTNAATVYISNSPTAGSNTTITNGYALWVDAGNAQFDGDATINGTLNVRTAIDLSDNDILRFGSGDDWELFHDGTNNYMDLNVGNLLIRDTTTTRFTFARTTGDFTATGNVTAYSDERLKKDWVTLPENFVERLSKVKAGTYTRTDTGERQAGASAQDWQELLPEVVTTAMDEAEMLSLAYGNAALVSAVELAKTVVALKAELESLKIEVAALKGK